MSWTAEAWKRIYGRGGAWTAVLIVAGLIGVTAVNWFDGPEGDPWFNTRSAAEIVAGAMERERIVVSQPGTNWAPSVVVWSDWAGESYTNVIDPTVQRSFFEHLNPEKYIIRGWSADDPLPTTRGWRTWADLWAHDDPMEPFSGVAEFDPLAPANAYMMGRTWWSDNIWGGGDGQWYPVTNSWVLTTNLLHAVGRSMTACRWTIESSMDYAVYNSTYEVSAGGYGSASDAWVDLFVDALIDMVAAWTGTATPFETNGAVIVEHRGTLRWYQAGPLDDHARTLVIEEMAVVQNTPEPAVYMGAMTNAWGVGMLDPVTDYWLPSTFYHRSGRAASVAMETTNCLAVTVGGVTRLRNNLAAWDGRFYIVPGLYFADVDFPDHTTNGPSIWGGKTFGWRFSETNQAVVVEWSLEHMTNRAAFWGTP